MIYNFLGKFLLVALISISVPSMASSQLTNLPFGIVIGQTTNNEIEKIGVCKKQIKIKENYFRCEKFNMSNRFVVYSSQNETVSKIVFFEYEEFQNSLPRQWRKLGMKFRSEKTKENGTTVDDFKRIIKNQGADDVEHVNSKEYDFIEIVSFYIEDYFYEARFYKKGGLRLVDEYGLSSLSIYEGY